MPEDDGCGCCVVSIPAPTLVKQFKAFTARARGYTHRDLPLDADNEGAPIFARLTYHTELLYNRILGDPSDYLYPISTTDISQNSLRTKSMSRSVTLDGSDDTYEFLTADSGTYDSLSEGWSTKQCTNGVDPTIYRSGSVSVHIDFEGENAQTGTRINDSNVASCEVGNVVITNTNTVDDLTSHLSTRIKAEVDRHHVFVSAANYTGSGHVTGFIDFQGNPQTTTVYSDPVTIEMLQERVDQGVADYDFSGLGLITGRDGISNVYSSTDVNTYKFKGLDYAKLLKYTYRRVRIRVPSDHKGSYMNVEYEILEENDDTGEITSAGLFTVTWQGPGNPDDPDDDSWFAELDLPALDSDSEITGNVELIRYRGYTSGAWIDF